MTGTQIYYREGAHGAWSPRGQRQQISKWGVCGSWVARCRDRDVAGDGILQGWTSTVLGGCGLCHQHPSSLPCPSFGICHIPSGGHRRHVLGLGTRTGHKLPPNRRGRVQIVNPDLLLIHDPSPYYCCIAIFFPPKPARSHRALTLPRPPGTMRPPRWPSPSRATSSAPRHHPSGRVSLTGGCRQLRRLAGHDEGLEDPRAELGARLGAAGTTGWPSGCQQPDIPGGPQTDHPKWM